MLRIGICDDKINARDALRLSLEHLLRTDDGKVFYEFSSGEGVVNWLYKHSGELDLLFLDMELGGISGMEAARQIRQFNSSLMLVFVTGYADFVFDGYSVQAIDYIIKPAKEDRLKAVLNRAQELLETRQPQTFTFQNSDGMFRIPKRDILYLYSDRRLVKLVTESREYSFYGKLDDAEKTLGSGFIRIHQRYLVQTGAVTKIEKNCVTVGTACFPISRAMRQDAISSLAKDMLGGVT